jgi:hypothetical protein
MNPPVIPQIRPLSRRRMFVAIGIAIVADVLQLASGPFGWAFFDEIVDVVTMLIMMRLIGFHWLLLPTFAVEFIPLADMLPTWTGCVLMVVRARTKRQNELKQLSVKD